jgi:hypothetical protein
MSGTLEPCESPDSGCTLMTVFHGRLRGNRINGAFATSYSDPSMGLESGKWWEVRSKNLATR